VSGRVAEARGWSRSCAARSRKAWIATFGKGKYDDQPLFLPAVRHRCCRATGCWRDPQHKRRVEKHALAHRDAIAKMPRRAVKAKAHDGKESTTMASPANDPRRGRRAARQPSDARREPRAVPAS
jgi:hypothetical protein